MNKAVLSLIALPAALSTLAGCSTTDGAGGQGTTASGGADAPVGAQVAVFNELFRANASGLQQAAAAYCISTGPNAANPTVDPAVLAALGGNPRVKSAAACRVDEAAGVVDTATQARALLFNVRTASCASPNDCVLLGGYYEGNVSAQTNRYRARLADGVWTVSLVEMGPIS